MSAVSSGFPGSLFKLHLDCGREIDFDFFDEVPSTPSWASDRHAGTRGNATTAAVAGDEVRVVDGADEAADADGTDPSPGCPSPQLTAGRTPDSVSIATSGVEQENECEAADDETDDVVVGVVVDVRTRAVVALVHEPPDGPSDEPHDETPQETSPGAEDGAAARSTSLEIPRETSRGAGGGAAARSTSPETPVFDDSTPHHEEGVEAEADEDDDDDDEEPEALGIQELTLTVSNRKTRAVSSITAVSSMSCRDSSRDDSSEESDDAKDAMEAIAKALGRPRPPSSTGSLPTPGQPGCRPGRSRRLNMSFTNDEARRIQRENQLLLRRIVSQRSRQPRLAPAMGPPPSAAAPPTPSHRCSHTVNRARRVRDIERENQILLKKIQTVKRSPSQLSMSRSSSSMSGRYSYG